MHYNGCYCRFSRFQNDRMGKWECYHKNAQNLHEFVYKEGCSKSSWICIYRRIWRYSRVSVFTLGSHNVHSYSTTGTLTSPAWNPNQFQTPEATLIWKRDPYSSLSLHSPIHRLPFPCLSHTTFPLNVLRSYPCHPYPHPTLACSHTHTHTWSEGCKESHQNHNNEEKPR